MKFIEYTYDDWYLVNSELELVYLVFLLPLGRKHDGNF